MYIDGKVIPLAAFAMVTVVSIGVPIARAWARRLERGPQRLDLPPETNARLERMEQAIDAIAVEVERISEGQRFTTKLLAERPTPGLGAGEGHDATRNSK